jgi:hypothetical protein
MLPMNASAFFEKYFYIEFWGEKLREAMMAHLSDFHLKHSSNPDAVWANSNISSML